MAEFIFERYNYWAIILLMMVGLYVTFQAGNLVKRMVGLSVFQTSVFLFYITLGKIRGGSAPILYGRDYPKEHGGGHGDDHGDSHGAAHGGADADHGAGHSAGSGGPSDMSGVDELGRPYVDGHIDPGHVGGEPLQELYSNPLPHVLILTAIVVGVATLAVGLAIIVRIRESYGTIEMDEVRTADIEHAKTEASAESA
ncbi:MAG: NADH-quinone oxidoreductase [Ponticaulis sp.]|nr:NADH-quinone oxidoreductase [Ponticaulis sp.]